MQIYDLAKERGVTAKELMADLRSKGFEVKSPLSRVTDEMLTALGHSSKTGEANEGLLQVRPTGRRQSEKVFGVSQVEYEKMAQGTSPKLTAAEEGYLSELRRRLSETGEINENKLSELRKFQESNAPSELSKTVGGDMVMSKMSLATASETKSERVLVGFPEFYRPVESKEVIYISKSKNFGIGNFKPEIKHLDGHITPMEGISFENWGFITDDPEKIAFIEKGEDFRNRSIWRGTHEELRKLQVEKSPLMRAMMRTEIPIAEQSLGQRVGVPSN